MWVSGPMRPSPCASTRRRFAGWTREQAPRSSTDPHTTRAGQAVQTARLRQWHRRWIARAQRALRFARHRPPEDRAPLAYRDRAVPGVLPRRRTRRARASRRARRAGPPLVRALERGAMLAHGAFVAAGGLRERLRSEEHTSELQSLAYLVC